MAYHGVTLRRDRVDVSQVAGEVVEAGVEAEGEDGLVVAALAVGGLREQRACLQVHLRHRTPGRRGGEVRQLALGGVRRARAIRSRALDIVWCRLRTEVLQREVEHRRLVDHDRAGRESLSVDSDRDLERVPGSARGKVNGGYAGDLGVNYGCIDNEALRDGRILWEVRLYRGGAAEGEKGVRGRGRDGELAARSYGWAPSLVVLAAPVACRISKWNLFQKRDRNTSNSPCIRSGTSQEGRDEEPGSSETRHGVRQWRGKGATGDSGKEATRDCWGGP